jgi:hypothetical protein
MKAFGMPYKLVLILRSAALAARLEGRTLPVQRADEVEFRGLRDE